MFWRSKRLTSCERSEQPLSSRDARVSRVLADEHLCWRTILSAVIAVACGWVFVWAHVAGLPQPDWSDVATAGVWAVASYLLLPLAPLAIPIGPLVAWMITRRRSAATFSPPWSGTLVLIVGSVAAAVSQSVGLVRTSVGAIALVSSIAFVGALAVLSLLGHVHRRR